MRPTPGILFNSWLPIQERHGCTGKSPTEGHQDTEGTGVPLLREKAERAGPTQPGKEEAQGDLINVYKCLKGRCKEQGARLFLVVCSTRARGNRQNIAQEIPSEHQYHFCAVWVTEHWLGLPRGCGFSSSEIFRSCLARGLSTCTGVPAGPEGPRSLRQPPPC